MASRLDSPASAPARHPFDRLRGWWSDPAGHAFLLGLLSGLPLLVWWLGWFPGFLSSDSIDQLRQADSFEIKNVHPAFHTLTLWAVTRVWDNAGAVTLAQVVALTGLLALTAYRLTRLGVPSLLSAGSVAAIAALPAVSTTTLAIWKDVPFTLALLWAFTEVLAMAARPGAYWDRLAPAVRLGTALGLVWLYRHNGFITVILFLAVLAVAFRDRWRRLVLVAGTVAVFAFGVPYVLYPALDIDRGAIEPGRVFISDVAASLTHEPGNFSSTEIGYLESIAPLSVWTGAYDCTDSTPLAFDPAFDGKALDGSAGRFRSLAIRTYLRDPDTVLGHRWCAASYLFWPPQPRGAYFHRPPFAVHPNDLGIERQPISDRAFATTKAIFSWVEPNGRLWLTWRPALVVWLTGAAYAAFAWRPRLRRLLLAGALIAAQVANVAITTPAQEFRFAFAIYLMGLASLPLLWLVARPGDARLE